jgi:hypothetical protein
MLRPREGSDRLVAGFANRLNVFADTLDSVASAQRQAGGDGEKGKKLTGHVGSPLEADWFAEAHRSAGEGVKRRNGGWFRRGNIDALAGAASEAGGSAPALVSKQEKRRRERRLVPF